jgi:hypothetical protein
MNSQVNSIVQNKKYVNSNPKQPSDYERFPAPAVAVIEPAMQLPRTVVNFSASSSLRVELSAQDSMSIAPVLASNGAGLGLKNRDHYA